MSISKLMKLLASDPATHRKNLFAGGPLETLLLSTVCLLCSTSCSTSSSPSGPLPFRPTIAVQDQTVDAVLNDGSIEEREFSSPMNLDNGIGPPQKVNKITSALAVSAMEFTTGGEFVAARVALLCDGSLAWWNDPQKVQVFSAADVKRALGQSVLSVQEGGFILADGTVYPFGMKRLFARQDLGDGDGVQQWSTYWRQFSKPHAMKASLVFFLLGTGDLYNAPYMEEKIIPGPSRILPDVTDAAFSKRGEGKLTFVAARKDGTAWYWSGPSPGYDTIPQRPTQIPNLTGIKQVRAASNSIWFIQNDGHVLMWLLTSPPSPPVPVPNIDHVADLRIEENTAFALIAREDGSTVFWMRDGDKGEISQLSTNGKKENKPLENAACAGQ